MHVLGIREARDIDIVTKKDLYDQLFTDPSWSHKEVPYGINLCKGDVEILPQLEWDKYPTTVEQGLERSTNVEGVNFMSLQDVKEFKTALGREKDLKDLELIRQYELKISGENKILK